MKDSDIRGVHLPHDMLAINAIQRFEGDAVIIEVDPAKMVKDHNYRWSEAEANAKTYEFAVRTKNDSSYFIKA